MERTKNMNDEPTPSTDDLVEAINEGSREKVDEKTARRFYDRLRETIGSYITRKGDRLGKARDFLFLVPDVFILLWRLAQDKRVSGKNKVLLGTGLAYYIFPLDVMPELFLGPIGFLDDLVFGAYILNKMLLDTDEGIVREHWSGSEDVLQMIRRVLQSADGLVSSDFAKTIKNMMK